MDVTREVVLEATVADVWTALTDPEELSAWFGGDVTINPTVGGTAAFVEDGVRRSAIVDAIDEGRRLALRWWSDAEPDDVSSVVFTVEEIGERTRVVVTETFPAACARAGGAWCAVGEASVQWHERFVGLELRFLAAPALV
jgi:uncharacterized protein YndB with AHSA1/START domain